MSQPQTCIVYKDLFLICTEASSTSGDTTSLFRAIKEGRFHEVQGILTAKALMQYKENALLLAIKVRKAFYIILLFFLLEDHYAFNLLFALCVTRRILMLYDMYIQVYK